MRWWDGERWGASGPAAAYRAPETEGLALASLITAVLGIPVVPIVLGVMARNRIREAAGAKDGDGLAIAGIIIGAVSLALIVFVFLGLLVVGLSLG